MVNYAELMKLREKATPGPWAVKIGDFEFGGDDDYNIKTVPYVDANKKVICVFVPLDDRDTDVENYDDDAAYIVAACNAVPELMQQILELSGTVTRLGLMLADAYKYIDTVRLPESGTPVMAPPDLRDMIEKFRRENFTEDTAGAGGKDHA